MNLSPLPNTPIRTPQHGSSTKTLQLTPIWEEVVKNNRLPPGVNHDLIFKEISSRLEDLEWPVRQHAFRVLCDIIPIISNDKLDEKIIANNILSKIVVNLGHPAPGIRKVALETVQKYLKKTLQSEKMLENFIQYGVKEDLVVTDQAGILRENITLGTIISLVDVLKPFIVPENGGYVISQSFLAKIVEALSCKLENPVYREKCLEALEKLRDTIGEHSFKQTLKRVPEGENIINLMINSREEYEEKANENDVWSDETKSENSFGLSRSRESDSFDLDDHILDRKINNEPQKEKRANDSSEEFSDGTDTETYTKEPAPNDLEEDDMWQVARTVSNYVPPSFVAIDNTFPNDELDELDERKKDIAPEKEERSSGSSSPRVVLAAEFQFAKNKAITMTVTEDDKNVSLNNQQDSEPKFINNESDLVMKVLHNEPDEEEKARTPRRVRFGGEVIKLRTPDSDTTDITIEIHEADDNSEVKKEPVRELITIRQEKHQKEEEKPEVPETRSRPTSLIPLPVAPATKAPGRDPSPAKTEAPKVVSKDNCLSPKRESFDSVLSSSGSETDSKEKWGDEDSDCWQWTDLRLVEENLLKDLQNKENWKIQYQALEELKVVLINPKTIEKLEKPRNHDKLNSLLKCLLHKLPQTNNQQVTALALSIVSQLIETLPKEIIDMYVESIVQGLCRYVGGCKNLNLKIESVQSLKTLFGVLAPSRIIDVLLGDGCLFSSVSKLRENSLLVIMYATMTFPSDVFDVEKILEKVADSTIDIRRRVRHGSLEAIAILSQFCSSQVLADNIGRVVGKLSTPSAKSQLVAAVQARLSRRLLPTISSEGLVLYALQIPASRRIGNVGNPIGADVDWILSGTGSVSTGSAKSKTQLNTAKRLEIKPPLPLSPSKWAASERTPKILPPAADLPAPAPNPWTIQKNRTESLSNKNHENLNIQGTRFEKIHSPVNFYSGRPPEIFKSTGNLCEESKDIFGLAPLNFVGNEKSFRPEEITWALVPISALDEPYLGRERSNSLWGDGDNNPHYLSPSLAPLRPLYLKLQPSHDQFLLSRSSDDVRRNSYSHGLKKGQENDFTEIRLLTPTMLREKNSSVQANGQNGKVGRSEIRGSLETSTKIPVLSSKIPHRGPRSAVSFVNERKISDNEENLYSNKKQANFESLSNELNGAAPTFLPSIRTGQTESSYNLQKSPGKNKFEEVDEMKLQDTMTQLSGLLTSSKGINKSNNRDFYSGKTQHSGLELSRSNLKESEICSEDKVQNKLFDRNYLKHETLPNSVASAPAVISSETRDQIPSTSSSNSTDFSTLSGSESRLGRLTNGSGTLDYRNYHTYNPKIKGRKISINKNSSKAGINGNPFPDNLKPFDRPKEGLDTCFNQLESQQWEVNMLGLISLVRLLRHHPAIVLSQLHPIIVVLGRQIRNLRSQVARAACQASAEMFLTLKRNVEPDIDELSGPLFHRSADTNRFIRADCNQALDNMADNVGHAKAINVIISKGTTHQNATVRAVAARLLLRLSEKVGPEKLLSLPKENRDKMLQAGANLLMEGKLETRAFAKQVFRLWSSHPSFSSLIMEAVEPNIMRHISKTLISIKS